ncbi:MAG: hypothetical protein NTW20_09380 [Rhodobacterales bacterium]|nr:hypothetical protein [Rhodobacterales bacterium]
MNAPTLTQTRLANGIWEGTLTGTTGAAPKVEALYQNMPLDGVELTPLPGKMGDFLVRVPIPATVLSEGVQTILLRLGDGVLAQVTIVAGTPLEDDLRAEIGLLRAELDLLKRAFRRHCAETAGEDQIS